VLVDEQLPMLQKIIVPSLPGAQLVNPEVEDTMIL
jgi:hypothetical protein